MNQFSKSVINYNMRCIETHPTKIIPRILSLINYNMRCIETLVALIVIVVAVDKLQHEMY